LTDSQGPWAALAAYIVVLYAWIYSEKPKWWTAARPDGENLPAELVEAIELAREAAARRRGSLCPKPTLNE